MKRFLALALLIASLTALAACGGTAQSSTTTAGTTAAVTTTTAATSAAATTTQTTTVSTTTAVTTTTVATTTSAATTQAATTVTTTTAATTTATTATTAATTVATTAATTVATTATTAAEEIPETSAAYEALCSDVELLYTGMEDELPGLFNMEINAENMSYYLGVDDIDMIAGVASEPMMSSIAFSVCLIQVADDADIDAIKNAIETNVDPRKWCCVEAENVIVDNVGSKIILIMCNEPAEKIHENFLANIQ